MKLQTAMKLTEQQFFFDALTLTRAKIGDIPDWAARKMGSALVEIGRGLETVHSRRKTTHVYKNADGELTTWSTSKAEMARAAALPRKRRIALGADMLAHACHPELIGSFSISTKREMQKYSSISVLLLGQDKTQ